MLPHLPRAICIILASHPSLILLFPLFLYQKASTHPSQIKNRILRAKAASTNSFETLGLYAAAVVAGNLVQVDKDTLNYLTALYIISRALYVFTYVWLQDNRAFSPLRSVFWGAGIWSIVSLFIKAGNAVA